MRYRRIHPRGLDKAVTRDTVAAEADAVGVDLIGAEDDAEDDPGVSLLKGGRHQEVEARPSGRHLGRDTLAEPGAGHVDGLPLAIVVLRGGPGQVISWLEFVCPRQRKGTPLSFSG